jgi:hypothetical protein
MKISLCLILSLFLVVCFLGPTDKLFEQFRDSFSSITVDPDNLRLWEWPGTEVPHTFLVSRAQEAREFCQKHLLTESFGRDDYRELCELIIKFLGGKVYPILF